MYLGLPPKPAVVPRATRAHPESFRRGLLLRLCLRTRLLGTLQRHRLAPPRSRPSLQMPALRHRKHLGLGRLVEKSPEGAEGLMQRLLRSVRVMLQPRSLSRLPEMQHLRRLVLPIVFLPLRTFLVWKRPGTVPRLPVLMRGLSVCRKTRVCLL